jgi:hypothetical protein
MRKNWPRLALLTVAGLVTVSMSIAQTPAKTAPTAAELKKIFNQIAEGTEGESSAFDSLTNVAPRRLVAYLKGHEVRTEDLGVNLTADSYDAAHLKVFIYSYSSGGTRGTIHKPVLQWQNAAGQHFAYAINEECEFTEVYKLASPGRTLYLLLGQETANSYTEISEALVVELKGNYLLLNNAAFGKEPSLSVDHAKMTFNDSQQALQLVAVPGTRPPISKEIYVPSPFPLAHWGQKGKPAPKKVTLKFIGTRFIQNQ